LTQRRQTIWVWTPFVVEGDEAVVVVAEEEVETQVEAEDREDDDPAWDEIDEEPDAVAGEPTPWGYLC
jgi:hypothetical protein